MTSQCVPPVARAPQWAYNGPSHHNQMEQNYDWHGPPSGAYARNQNNNYGRRPGYGYGQNPHNNYNHYNVHGNRPVLSCEPCGKTFGSNEILKEHLEEHVQCPFPECRLSACIKVIDTHITNQHMLVNFADLQIDDEAWIKQRKQRFPTAERAKIRREQQMEMIRRGQKIGLEKQRLGKYNKFDKPKKYESKPLNHEKNKPNENDLNKEKVKPFKKRETFRERKERIKNEKREKIIKREEETCKLSKSFIEDVYDSDSEIKDGLPAFKGTKLFYEEIGLSSPLSDIEEVLSDNAISDDEEWNNNQAVDSINKSTTDGSSKLVLGNALGSLMGAYDSDSEESMVDLPHSEPITNKIVNENHEVEEKIINNDQEENKSKNDQDIILEQGKESGERNGTKRNRNRRHRRNKHKDVEKEDSQNNSESVSLAQNQVKHVKPKRPPPVKRRRPTLLMRLLEADIRHERNILLQCIRYIVQNNFFEEEVECESSAEMSENDCEDTNTNNTDQNGEKESSSISNDLKKSSKSATKRKANSNLAESSKSKEAKLLDALTEFHKKNFDRVASMFADDDDDEVTSVEAYLNRKNY